MRAGYRKHRQWRRALGGGGSGFFDQLSPGFDPIVRGIPRQGKLNAALREEVGADSDFVVCRFAQGRWRGSFLGSS